MYLYYPVDMIRLVALVILGTALVACASGLAWPLAARAQQPDRNASRVLWQVFSEISYPAVAGSYVA
jgi:hypothetical protein